jgi:nucleoside 2-deoxyribosyltransferase
MQTSRSIILSPWDPDSQQLRDTIAATLRDFGVEVIELRGSGPELQYAILKGIQSSDFVVADVSQQNPNVMYEIGLAQGMKKPTILLISLNSKGIPFDLEGSLFVVYDSERPESLREALSWRLKQSVGELLVPVAS